MMMTAYQFVPKRAQNLTKLYFLCKKECFFIFHWFGNSPMGGDGDYSGHFL